MYYLQYISLPNTYGKDANQRKTSKVKKQKKFSLNVTNIIYDFKNKTVEIQDEIGVTDKRVQVFSFKKFIQHIESIE